MVNRPKIRGTNFETAVVNYLLEHGYPDAHRLVLKGRKDEGDIGGVPGWTLECKDEKQIDLATAVNEAVKERENSGTPWWAAIIKRRGKNVAKAYLVVDVEEFCQLTAPDNFMED